MKTWKQSTFIGIMTILVLSFTLVACGDENTHEHQWGSWRSNATRHWKECSCGEEYGSASHSGNPCFVCYYDSSTGTITNSLNGVWKSTSTGNVMSIYDNKAVATEISAADWKEAESRGNVGIGSLVYRNITSIGDLTWSGQRAEVISPNYTVSWGGNSTFTLSANSQTLTVSGINTTTWTRVPHNGIDGVWKSTSTGNVMSIYDNKAVATVISAADWKEAERRGNVGIGSLVYRNITSTGNSTWSGQAAVVNSNTYTVSWDTNRTFTLSANEQTLTVSGSTWTRQQ